MSFVDHLLTWYRQSARNLPWRRTRDPYRVWLSEVMLQQTRVDTVIPYYERFLSAYPSIDALAAADEQSVLKLWEGLGYYSRARNLRKAAREVAEQHQGELPNRYDRLRQLPGFGPYTAAAVASIAFGEAVPVVDGNVLRVFARFWAIEDDIRAPRVKTQLFERLSPFVRQCDPSHFNQAIMELGALVCLPKRPKCEACPLRQECRARIEGRQGALPVKSKKSATPHKEIAVAVIWRDGQLLIGKRKVDQMLGGLWEFPGGKRRADESLEETAIREIREETGLEIELGAPYCTVEHAYSHFSISLTAFRATYRSGEALPHSTDELRWVRLDELDAFPFPTANKRVIEAIVAQHVTKR